MAQTVLDNSGLVSRMFVSCSVDEHRRSCEEASRVEVFFLLRVRQDFQGFGQIAVRFVYSPSRTSKVERQRKRNEETRSPFTILRRGENIKTYPHFAVYDAVHNGVRKIHGAADVLCLTEDDTVSGCVPSGGEIVVSWRRT